MEKIFDTRRDKVKKSIVLGMTVLIALLIQTGTPMANKSSTLIEAPSEVEKGEEVTLRILVNHNANNLLHYTNWVRVTANNNEIAHWKYTMFQRPEAAQFIREIKIKVMEDIEVIAEANCNLHGSQGPARHRIRVK